MLLSSSRVAATSRLVIASLAFALQSAATVGVGLELGGGRTLGLLLGIPADYCERQRQQECLVILVNEWPVILYLTEL